MTAPTPQEPISRRTILEVAAAGAAIVAVGGAAPAAAAGGGGRGRTHRHQARLSSRTIKTIRVDGLEFRDLNKDGILQPYEDWRLPARERAQDLLSRMSLEEKAGTMVHPIAFNSATGYYFDDVPSGAPPFFRALRPNILDNHVTSLLTAFSPADASVMVDQHNRIQEIAEQGRLGIPVSLSSDPRNGFSGTAGQSVQATAFTRWPGSLGFAAIGDPELVREFGDACRREYVAVGLAVALSPQADIATEPRWSRINGTFGEDVRTVSRLTERYIRGFQAGADGIGPDSVVCVVKHFAGYGAQVNGFDSHYEYGEYAAFPGGNFATHLQPFRSAIRVGAGSVMPTYSILQGVTIHGKPLEQVGAGFNRQLLTEVLRGDLGFDGVIVSDWQITDDAPADPAGFGGKPWGVKELSEQERFAKAINAGVDQFGGTSNADKIVAAVKAGQVTMRQIDASVFRILLQKFQQGLFENPFRDAAEAMKVVGSFARPAEKAQHRSVVVLENKAGALPLRRGRVFLRDIDAAVATAHGLTVTDTLADADVALLRVSTPSSGEHGADLDFTDDNDDYRAIVEASAVVPTVVAIELDRPAILTDVRDKVAGLVAHFGISDDALLDVLTGRAGNEGRLPFDLPRSMDAVRAQKPDVPYDTAAPLYRHGYGLRLRGHR